MAVKYHCEPGTYKFSFLHKKGESGLVYAGLVYATSIENLESGNYELAKMFGDNVPQKKGTEAGDLFESNEIEITEAGDYYFAYYVSYSVEKTKVRIADFNLLTEAAASTETWPEPAGTTKEDRYVTSASTTGAVKELSYSAEAAPSGLYVNTQSGMTVEQGQSFDLSMQTTEDTKFTHAIVYVDWNHNYSFDDEGEQLFKVGMDVYEETELPYLDNQGNPSAGGNIQNPAHISVKGNPDVLDFTKTIEVPANAALGTTRMRVIYTDAWHGTADDPKHLSTDAVDKGRVYDFDVTITEHVAQDGLLTVDAENCTVTVKNWEGTEVVTYEDGDRIPLNTRLLIQATANEGYTDATFTVNGQKWNSYAAWDVEEDVHIVATAAKEEVCVVNYTFEGEGLGSMAVYDVSGYSMVEIENGGTVAIGGAVNVSVAMNEETVKGTIVINDGEPEEFDYASGDGGTYSKRIKIEEGMENIDIAVKLEQGEAPVAYKVDFSITNPELADEYWFMGDNGSELVVGTNEVAEGAQLGLMVLFESNEDVSGVVKVDGAVVDKFDFESCQGVYRGTVVESVDRDLKVEVELTDGSGLGSNKVDGVAVYPTVFTDNVTVAVPADGRVTVYDLSGAAVYTAEVVAGSNVLGLGNLGDGLYVVKVESDGASTTVQVLKK